MAQGTSLPFTALSLNALPLGREEGGFTKQALLSVSPHENFIDTEWGRKGSWEEEEEPDTLFGRDGLKSFPEFKLAFGPRFDL